MWGGCLCGLGHDRLARSHDGFERVLFDGE